jgi:ABC-type transport system involved in multi-copper enzyme maturation permease subunit
VGTYAIIQALWKHWRFAANPIYRFESRRADFAPAARIASRFVRRVWRPAAAVITVVLATIVADFFCAGARILPLSLSTAFFTLCSLIGGGLILVAVMLFAYLWPVAVAVNASGVIVQERERQTWDLLLTTPFDRGELLLAKLASSLRLFNPYGEMLLWVQSFLAVILSVLIVSEFTEEQTGGWVVQVLLLCLALVEFGFGRMQDYALSGLIGLAASLLTTTREAAWASATLLALMLILLRAVLTIAVLASAAPEPFPKLLVLFATGPASAIVTAWPAAIAGLTLILLPLAREGLIRALYVWLVRNLGEAPTRHAA